MVNLFDSIANKMWELLESQTKIQSENNKKEQSKGIFSIVRILGSLSPLILNISGRITFKNFFKRLLEKCERKVLRTFTIYDKK